MLTAHTLPYTVAYPLVVPLATTLQPDRKEPQMRLLIEHLGHDMKGFPSPLAQHAQDVIISKAEDRLVWRIKNADLVITQER